MRDQAALAYAIHRSCTNKAEVVAPPTSVKPANGHCSISVIPSATPSKPDSATANGCIGEAVAAGTLIAAELSRRLGWLADDAVLRIEKLFVRAGLPVKGAPLGAARYLELMRHDKKVQDGRLRLVLLKGIGSAVVSDAAAEATIVAAIDARCT